MTEPTLIIGYGNTLRSDDGVGPRLAQTVADWRLPGVRSLALHGVPDSTRAGGCPLSQVRIMRQPWTSRP